MSNYYGAFKTAIRLGVAELIGQTPHHARLTLGSGVSTSSYRATGTGPIFQA